VKLAKKIDKEIKYESESNGTGMEEVLMPKKKM
jgi:hypothetical protein